MFKRILNAVRRRPAVGKQRASEPPASAATVFRTAGTQPVEKPYTPPAGFPADPVAWLAYLEAGQFTPEQELYLRSNALAIYESALGAARGNPALVAEVALGNRIAAAWRAWLTANPAP